MAFQIFLHKEETERDWVYMHSLTAIMFNTPTNLLGHVDA